VWCSPPTTTSNALSYSLSQTSHVAIHKCFACREVGGGVQFQQQLEIRQESDNFLPGGSYANTKTAHRLFKRK
jgi:hypothetical protein